MPLVRESDKWLHLVRETIDEQQERPTLVMVITVIHLGIVHIVRIQVHHSKVFLDAYLGATDWVITIMDVLWVVLHVRISSFVRVVCDQILKDMVHWQLRGDSVDVWYD